MQRRSWSDIADATAQQAPHIPWSKMMLNRNAQSGYWSRRSKLAGILAAIGGRTIGFCVVPPVVEVVVVVVDNCGDGVSLFFDVSLSVVSSLVFFIVSFVVVVVVDVVEVEVVDVRDILKDFTVDIAVGFDVNLIADSFVVEAVVAVV